MAAESIDPRGLLIKVAQILEELRIPYAVTGGMAIYVWGRPRFTADVDVVMNIRAENIKALAKELKSLSEINYVEEKSIKRALERKGEFNFIDGASGIKVDFWISGEDKFSQSQLHRRMAKKVLGQKIFFVSPEDLILSKLIWYKKSESSRQLEDVESILKISGKRLDMKYLRKWVKILEVESLLNKLLRQRKET